MSDSHNIQKIQGTTAMHPLVESATRSGEKLDVETMRDLMKLQREWEAGEARKSFTVAMVKLKMELPSVIGRDKRVAFNSRSGHTEYTHTTLAHAVDCVVPVLTTHGFSYHWQTEKTQRDVRVTCKLMHKGGHIEENSLEAPPATSGHKSPAQAVASTVTLLQRYTLLSLLGIATKEHADPAGAEPMEKTTKQILTEAGRIDIPSPLGDSSLDQALGSIESSESHKTLTAIADTMRDMEWSEEQRSAIKKAIDKKSSEIKKTSQRKSQEVSE